MFDSLINLLQKLNSFFAVAIPSKRIGSNDGAGRQWFLEHIEYKGTLKLSSLRDITDRDELNGTFTDRYNDESVQSRKGVSALKTEISALYSFQKCFVQRYKGRLHFYRDDLSQKGARTMCATGSSYGLFNEFKKNLD
jgi:hypothetical protein